MTHTIQTIQTNMGRVIQHETGAAVEVTIIAANRFSVFTLDAAAIAAARDILTRVPGVRLQESMSYSDADLAGETEYYDYYTTEPA